MVSLWWRISLLGRASTQSGKERGLQTMFSKTHEQFWQNQHQLHQNWKLQSTQHVIIRHFVCGQNRRTSWNYFISSKLIVLTPLDKALQLNRICQILKFWNGTLYHRFLLRHHQDNESGQNFFPFRNADSALSRGGFLPHFLYKCRALTTDSIANYKSQIEKYRFLLVVMIFSNRDVNKTKFRILFFCMWQN